MRVLYLGVRYLADGDRLLPQEADRGFILLQTFCLQIYSMNFFVLLKSLSQLSISVSRINLCFDRKDYFLIYTITADTNEAHHIEYNKF